MIETIILDLDGPLLDGKHRHYQCYRDILLEKGFKPVSLSIYWKMKRNCVGRHKLLDASGAVAIYDYFLKTWVERIEQKKYLVLDRLQNQTVKILKEWKRARARLLLVTMRNNPSTLDWQLKRLGILPLMDKLISVGSLQIGASKSQEVRRQLKQIDPEKTLWIGDTEVDIRAARELGVKICAVSCGLRSSDFLSKLRPDYLEPDLKSFFGKYKKRILTRAIV